MVLREREDLLPALALGFTGFYWILLAFTGFYWVFHGFTGARGSTTSISSRFATIPTNILYRLLLASTGLYRLLLSFTGFYWAFLVLRGRKDVLLPARAQGSQPRPLW